jgi:SAM-dependent MidA family methyltransferase
MDRALYGSNGFYRRNAPGAHFRTSVPAGDELATAVARLVAAVGATEVVDLGAGRGALLTALESRLPAVALHGVEVVARPEALPERVGWSELAPLEGDGIRLLLANEWLDNVPVDVVEIDVDGVPRLVFVAPNGFEQPGDPPSAADAAWLARWWPLDGAPPGTRAEVGWPRDQAWAATVRSVQRGLAVAIDRAHAADCRPEHGTLTGYRDGRPVPPIPDGSTDLIAHVALDACAAAGVAAGACATVLRVPGTHDGFSWLIQAVGIEMPTALDQI